jgi:hypothetical protein
VIAAALGSPPSIAPLTGGVAEGQAEPMRGRHARPQRALSQREMRSLRAEAAQHRDLFRKGREAFIDSQLGPGERVVARNGTRPVVTDRRILDARLLDFASRGTQWVLDVVAFEEVTSWADGRAHDGRPMLRLEHRPMARMEHLPEHRFLWLEWGNTYGPVPRTTTTFEFGRESNPVLLALRDRLASSGIPQGLPFEIRPPRSAL